MIGSGFHPNIADYWEVLLPTVFRFSEIALRRRVTIVWRYMKVELGPRPKKSTPDAYRHMHELPPVPLRGGMEFFANSAFFTLRAVAAQNHNDRVGLKPAIFRTAETGSTLAPPSVNPIQQARRFEFRQACIVQSLSSRGCQPGHHRATPANRSPLRSAMSLFQVVKSSVLNFDR